MTLLVSSHILSELEDYCTDMLLLRDGKLVDHCSKISTQEELPAHKVTMLLYEDAKSHIDTLSKIKDVGNVTSNEEELICSFAGDEEALNGLLKKVISKKIPVYSFTTEKKRLQDIYMDYAQQESADVSK
jgi:ABC-2 type transport system ATP-binding protein